MSSIIYRGGAKLFTFSMDTGESMTGWTLEQRFRQSATGSPALVVSLTVAGGGGLTASATLTAAQSATFGPGPIITEFWRTDSGLEDMLKQLPLTVIDTIPHS